MALVSLQFPPSAEYVRTARLVAVSVARRGRVSSDPADRFDEDRLDDLRPGDPPLRRRRVCERADPDGTGGRRNPLHRPDL
jgi:hypothetical protein